MLVSRWCLGRKKWISVCDESVVEFVAVRGSFVSEWGLLWVPVVFNSWKEIQFNYFDDCIIFVALPLQIKQMWTARFVLISFNGFVFKIDHIKRFAKRNYPAVFPNQSDQSVRFGLKWRPHWLRSMLLFWTENFRPEERFREMYG